MKRARQPSRCDAPGCTETIRRGMLMCLAHWRATPQALREAIKSAWKEGRIRDWSENCLNARSWHAQRQRGETPSNPVTPERSAQLRDRILGERN